MTEAYKSMSNGLLMWLACAPGILIVIFQSLKFFNKTRKSASAMGLTDKQVVSVKVPSNGRNLIFGDVVVRVSDKYALAMHIDTDESNAGCIAPNAKGIIIK